MEQLMTYDLEQIDNAANWLLSNIKNHRIIAFQGGLGAGKTTLIKSICRQLDVKDDTSSPTFNIINQYKIDDKQIIYHIDFYRIKSPEETIDLGIFDIFDSGHLCLLEWPLLIENLLPEATCWVQIAHAVGAQSPDQRMLSINDLPTL